ncbi:MAG: DUF1080 domain-containing protein [Verrucomicrobia bacterium]|nr:DUF1080 domain-containing protein [Verrucomicrobiota bacterium]
MNDSRDPVALQTLDQLARWPDPAPVEHLLAVAETGANAARRNRALASAIRLATTAADERQRPEDTLVRWLERASRAAQTTGERRLVISGLGRLKRVESLRVLAAYLNDPGVRNEAAGAVLQIAPALCQANPPLLRQTLENIAATAPNPDFRRQAAKLAGTLPAQHAPRPLFDGRSLAGWEGNTNVWRVRDGAIVGGSLEGNPRNEFLATLRSYTNFVLRLEYKLVGTGGFVNGGVQFHSVRVQQPPNEMRGYQADIGAGYSGSLYDESRRNKVLMQAAKDQAQRLEKPGDWNRYEVHCHGPRIRIALNGETTVDYTEPDAAIPAFGLIALQIHGNGKSEIAFRNLTVEEGIQP